MTAYLFLCDDCGIDFTESFPIGQRPDTLPCPVCEADAKHRIAWNGGTVLRGSGWAKHSDRDTANFKKGPQ
jgi:putative FmdB family regulatory protein